MPQFPIARAVTLALAVAGLAAAGSGCKKKESTPTPPAPQVGFGTDAPADRGVAQNGGSTGPSGAVIAPAPQVFPQQEAKSGKHRMTGGFRFGK